MSSGECEAALELCSGHALENVKISIESGCPPYTTQIDSVTCIIDQNHADCICYESRDQYPELSFPYELEKIDGQWKLIENTKSVSTEMD